MKRRDFLKTTVLGAAAMSMAGRMTSATEQEKGNIKQKTGKSFYTVDGYGHFSSIKYMDLLEQLSGRPDPSRALSESRTASFDPDERMKAMDECGVDESDGRMWRGCYRDGSRTFY